MELEGAAMELAGAAAGAGRLAGVARAAGVAAEAPESVSDFLLLRVRLVLAAVVPLEVVLAESVAEAVAAPRSTAGFSLLLVFLVAVVTLEVVLADSVAAASAFLLFWWVFFAAVALVAELSGLAAALESAGLVFFDFLTADFLAVDFSAVVDEVSAAATD